MAVLKYFDGSDWEPVVSALQGPTGPTGAASTITGPTGVTGATGPTGSDASSGLTLINTTSFSAVSSVSLPDDTFTSTYNDYKILFRLTASGGAGYVQMRLRASGADNTTSNYNSQGVGRRVNQTTVGFESASDNLFYLIQKDTADSAGASIDLFSPKATNNTLYNSSIQAVFINTSDSTNFAGGGIFKATTSFDSATFISNDSTITGSVSVFGYAK